MRNRFYISFRHVVWILPIIALLTCCSAEMNDNTNDVMSEERPVNIIPTIGDTSSRVAASEVLTSFYVTAFSGLSNKGKNIKYTWKDGQWTSTKKINWPSGNTAISFWGLSQSFANGKGISNSTMTYAEQHFDFTVDTLSAHDLLFASTLETSYNVLGGSVHLDFNYALAYPYFTCVQGIEDVTVIIKEVIVHNLRTTGTLTFDAVKDSKAAWKLVSGKYGNYKQVFDTPVTLNPDLATAVRLTDSWIWIPQSPTKWKTTEAKPVPISEADEKHHCYVELKCQIIKNGRFIWGEASGDNEWESVYYPFSTNFKALAYSRPIQLTFTGGYLEDGTPWQPHTGEQITIANWITEDILVDPWQEMDPEDLIF